MSEIDRARPIESYRVTPGPMLARWVEHHWVARWDLREWPPYTNRLLSDPSMHVCFEAGASRVVGVWTTTFERTLEGMGLVRAVKLRAGAGRILFAGPLHALSDAIHPLSSVFDGDTATLEHDVLGPADDAIAFEVIERWLEAHLRRVETEAVDLAMNLAQKIRDQPALTSVDALVAETRIPKRTVQRIFRDYIGASPKWAIRRHRLQEASVRLAEGELTSLAALAADLGYADQAHLARDFRRAVGESPRDFVSRMRE